MPGKSPNSYNKINNLFHVSVPAVNDNALKTPITDQKVFNTG